MTTFADANTSKSPFDFFNLDGSATQYIQDSELIRQLPFIPGLKELLMLRQVHALEHATVWVLSDLAQTHQATDSLKARQIDNELLSGLSTDQGFYLYGQVNKVDLQDAVSTALKRLTSGEWDLAVHPRCGTNLSVGMLLTAGLAVGIHLLLPRGPIEQILGLGVAAATAAQLTPDLGILAQRYVTTAVPFNLTIEQIQVKQDVWGRSAHFVEVRWRD